MGGGGAARRPARPGESVPLQRAGQRRAGRSADRRPDVDRALGLGRRAGGRPAADLSFRSAGIRRRLLTMGMALLAAGLIAPEPTLLLAQAACLGLALTLLAGMLERGVARRRRTSLAKIAVESAARIGLHAHRLRTGDCRQSALDPGHPARSASAVSTSASAQRGHRAMRGRLPFTIAMVASLPGVPSCRRAPRIAAAGHPSSPRSCTRRPHERLAAWRRQVPPARRRRVRAARGGLEVAGVENSAGAVGRNRRRPL